MRKFQGIEILAAVLAVLSLLLSCGGGASDGGPFEMRGAIRAPTLGALPLCWLLDRGQVYYVEDSERFYYCDGRNYVELDLQGLDGADGIGWVVAVEPADDADCPAGGATIEAGPDADQDGVLDQVASTEFVCDGVDGQDGGSCSVSENGDGTQTIACDDGTSVVVGGGNGGGATSGLALVDAEGFIVGPVFTGLNDGGFPSSRCELRASLYVSEVERFVTLDVGLEGISKQNIYFETTDCTGQASVAESSLCLPRQDIITGGPDGSRVPYLNYPLAISDGERLYGADEPRSEVVVRSFFQLGNCNPLIEGPLDVLALTDITPDDWPPPEPLELRIPEL